MTWVVVAVLACVPAHAAEIIDRVIAVVNGAVITLSDMQAAVRLGVVPVPEGQGRGAAVLERLIERRLTLTEVNRYASGEPSSALVDERLRQVKARFATDEDLGRVLAEVGVTPDQLRAYLRDEVRIETYLQQRFSGGGQPADAEILDYYRAHPQDFMRNGLALTFSEAYDDARAAVIRERRDRLAREWIAGLRRRADVTIPAVVRR